jgi:hypothetical protein
MHITRNLFEGCETRTQILPVKWGARNYICHGKQNLHSFSPDIIYIRLKQLYLPSSMRCQHKRDNNSHRTQPSRESVPTFPTLCNSICHFSLTLRSRIHFFQFVQLFVWRRILKTDTSEVKLIISKIAIFGVATPSRRHSPENSSGHIQGQENVTL